MSFEEKIDLMKKGGEILRLIFEELKDKTKAGITSFYLDNLAQKLFNKFKVKSAFKEYKADFSNKPYPANICVSLNEIIVHGIPRKNQFIKEGDIIKLDMGIIYKGLYLDAAITIGVGSISKEAENLIMATKEALINAISISKEGYYIEDLGEEIEKIIEYKNNFKVIKNLCGHDIGEYLHGDLQILNFKQNKRNKPIKKGMIFTIEPMASLSSNYGVQINDFEFKTEDNSISSHFEVTLAVLGESNIVLTNIL
jgi:methionyl aminopeptidase